MDTADPRSEDKGVTPTFEEFGIAGGGVLTRDWDKARQISAQSARSDLTDWTLFSEDHLNSPRNKGAKDEKGKAPARNWRKVPTPAVLSTDYVLKRVVGEGAFGIVYGGKHLPSGELVAVKSIAIAKLTEKWMVDQLEEEVHLTAMFEHPYIISMHEIFRDDTTVYIIMDLLKGPTLFKKVLDYPHDPDSCSKRKGLPISLVARYLWQMLVSIGHCHTHGVVHRDVKPENFLFAAQSDRSPLKLIDFGFACKFEPNVPITLQVGSPYYMAPEILTASGYDESVDIYGVAVCAYFTIVAKLPYNGVEINAVIEAAREGNLCTDGPEWENVPQECIALIRQMMSLDPATRPQAKHLLSEKGTWLRHHGWDTQQPDKMSENKCCAIC